MNAKIMKGKSAGGLIDYLNSMKEKNAKVIFPMESVQHQTGLWLLPSISNGQTVLPR